MDTYGVTGDFEIVNKIISFVLFETELEYDSFRKKVFELIFSVITSEKVYNGLKILADLVHSHSPQTITKEEINKSFKDNSVDEFLLCNSKDLNGFIHSTFQYEKWDL